MKQSVFLLTLFLAPALFANEVDRLLDQYKKLQTVTCQIRRTVSGEAGKIKFISRVYWADDDRLHVDNLSPVPRRIVSNGAVFYSYAEGDPRGFSRPVSDLSYPMTLSLRKIPGTAMDHLLRLKGAEEQTLESENGLRQVGCSTGDQFVVLKFDEMDRLTAVEFYKTGAQQSKIGSYTYSKFSEVAPGVWIPLLHEASLPRKDGPSFSETVHVDRFVANEPLANSLFDADTFFSKDIDFVDSFEKLYQE